MLIAYELIEQRCRAHELSRARIHRVIVFLGALAIIGLFII